MRKIIFALSDGQELLSYEAAEALDVTPLQTVNVLGEEFTVGSVCHGKRNGEQFSEYIIKYSEAMPPTEDIKRVDYLKRVFYAYDKEEKLFNRRKFESMKQKQAVQEQIEREVYGGKRYYEYLKSLQCEYGNPEDGCSVKIDGVWGDTITITRSLPSGIQLVYSVSLQARGREHSFTVKYPMLGVAGLYRNEHTYYGTRDIPKKYKDEYQTLVELAETLRVKYPLDDVDPLLY